MVSDPVSFNGNTRVEVITVLANCGRDTDRARRALVTWIQRKQAKGRSTDHILTKLRDIESKFIKDTSLHSVFRDARAETFLPRPPDLPPPSSYRQQNSDRRTSATAPSINTSVTNSIGPSSISSSPREFQSATVHQISPLTPSPPSSHHALRPETSARRVSASREAPSSVPQEQGVSFSSPSLPPRIQIPRARSLQPVSHSPWTSSPESDAGPRYRYMSQPVGPSTPVLRRAAPPRTTAPTSPLPPIPLADQNLESLIDPYVVSPAAEQPSTPSRPKLVSKLPPSRPLPLQPIFSPASGFSGESEHTVSINQGTLQRYWAVTHCETLRQDEVVRGDSPVYTLSDDVSQTGTGPPPPYVDLHGTYTPPDMPIIGNRLDRALKICGGSPEVRQQVIKCLEFHPGYEPPHWQSRLRACDLNLEATLYLLDEMSRQVDWSALGRAI